MFGVQRPGQRNARSGRLVSTRNVSCGHSFIVCQRRASIGSGISSKNVSVILCRNTGGRTVGAKGLQLFLIESPLHPGNITVFVFESITKSAKIEPLAIAVHAPWR